MPFCSYFNPTDLRIASRVEDPEVNELLQEVRKILPNYYLRTHDFCIENNLFRKPKFETFYNFFNMIDSVEGQILLVPREYVKKEAAMAFLHGMLIGLNNKQ